MLEWESPNAYWRISCQSRQIFPSDLRNRDFLIAVSLRNPKFSNRWLRAVITDIGSLEGRISLCLVDAPYFERMRNGDQDKEQRKLFLSALREQREQQQRRLARLASEFPSGVELFAWYDIEWLVPQEIGRELRSAFRLRGEVYECLMDQVRLSVGGLKSSDELELASIFLQREFPVLIYIYYVMLSGLIDVYPGPQANFFWSLERGKFREELPVSTGLAQASEGHIYADVSLSNKPNR